jgi:hypothetical protein
VPLHEVALGFMTLLLFISSKFFRKYFMLICILEELNSFELVYVKVILAEMLSFTVDNDWTKSHAGFQQQYLQNVLHELLLLIKNCKK